MLSTTAQTRPAPSISARRLRTSSSLHASPRFLSCSALTTPAAPASARFLRLTGSSGPNQRMVSSIRSLLSLWEGSGRRLNLAPHRQELLGPRIAQFVRPQVVKRLERPADRLARRGDRGVGVAMRAAERLGDDAVDNAEPDQVLSGDLHARRRLLRAGGIAPEDRGGRFGRGHGV